MLALTIEIRLSSRCLVLPPSLSSSPPASCKCSYVLSQVACRFLNQPGSWIVLISFCPYLLWYPFPKSTSDGIGYLGRGLPRKAALQAACWPGMGLGGWGYLLAFCWHQWLVHCWVGLAPPQRELGIICWPWQVPRPNLQSPHLQAQWFLETVGSCPINPTFQKFGFKLYSIPNFRTKLPRELVHFIFMLSFSVPTRGQTLC